MSTVEHRPVLIVIAGPNGSGKTTITSRILKHEWLEGAVYINPDNVAQERFGDWNSPEAVMQAAQYCEEEREKCLRNKRALFLKLSFLLKVRSILFDVLMNLVTLFAYFSFLQIRMTNGKLFKLYIEDIPAWASSILNLT